MKDKEEKAYCGNGEASSLVHYFSVIYRHGRILRERGLKRFGLTGWQMRYLKYIEKNPGISQEDLARNLQIDKGAVAKAIKDMSEKGYVKRVKNPDDKRAYNLFTTDRASCICARGHEYLAEFEKKMVQGMTDEEIATFEALLGKVTDNILKMLEGEKI